MIQWADVLALWACPIAIDASLRATFPPMLLLCSWLMILWRCYCQIVRYLLSGSLAPVTPPALQHWLSNTTRRNCNMGGFRILIFLTVFIKYLFAMISYFRFGVF